MIHHQTLAAAPKLELLPDNILIDICDDLSVVDILALRRTCMRLAEVSHARAIWLRALRKTEDHHGQRLAAGVHLGALDTETIERCASGPTRIEKTWLRLCSTSPSLPSSPSDSDPKTTPRTLPYKVPVDFSDSNFLLPGGRYYVNATAQLRKGILLFDLDAETEGDGLVEEFMKHPIPRFQDVLVGGTELGALIMLSFEIRARAHYRVEARRLRLPNDESPKGDLEMMASLTTSTSPRGICMGHGLVAFAVDGVPHRMVFWNYARGTYAQVPFEFENGELNNIQHWRFNLEPDRLIMANSFTFRICTLPIPEAALFQPVPDPDVALELSENPSPVHPSFQTTWPGNPPAGAAFYFFPKPCSSDNSTSLAQTGASMLFLLPRMDLPDQFCVIPPSSSLGEPAHSNEGVSERGLTESTFASWPKVNAETNTNIRPQLERRTLLATLVGDTVALIGESRDFQGEVIGVVFPSVKSVVQQSMSKGTTTQGKRWEVLPLGQRPVRVASGLEGVKVDWSAFDIFSGRLLLKTKTGALTVVDSK